MQETEELARWPSGGNRRKLEQKWLGLLEQHSLGAFLQEPPPRAPASLLKGIEEFNAGAFWDCHETLEALWLRTPYPLRFFYHAFIKVAVGLHHMSRHNRHGARVKLIDGVRLLRLFPQHYMGVATGRLLDEAAGLLSRVDGTAAVDWAALDALLRPIIGILDDVESVSTPGQ